MFNYVAVLGLSSCYLAAFVVWCYIEWKKYMIGEYVKDNLTQRISSGID